MRSRFFPSMVENPASLNRSSSMAVFFKVFFHFQGGHAARAGGGDCLAVPAVLHVATRKNSSNAGEHLVRGANVSVVIQIDQTAKHPGVGNMANPQEHGAYRQGRL